MTRGGTDQTITPTPPTLPQTNVCQETSMKKISSMTSQGLRSGFAEGCVWKQGQNIPHVNTKGRRNK